MTEFHFAILYVVSFGVGTVFFSALFLIPTYNR